MTRISDLLPEVWPDTVLNALKDWQQGHLIEAPPMFWAADPRHPLLPFTSSNADGSREWQIFSLPTAMRPEFGVVVSQTCDICEADPANPFVDIAPVVDLSDELDTGQKSELCRHRYNDYVYLTKQPAPDRFYVADLRMFLPLEKGSLVERHPIDGFNSEHDRLDFSDRVATRIRRPAYADAVQEHLIAPLNRWIRDTSKQALREKSGRYTDVEEVRLRVDGDRLKPNSVQLVVFQETPLDREDAAVWRNWRNEKKKSFKNASGIELLPIQFTSMSKMLAGDYRSLAPVWLSSLGREARV